MDEQVSEVRNIEVFDFVKVIQVAEFVWLKVMPISCIEILTEVRMVSLIGRVRQDFMLHSDKINNHPRAQ